MNLKEKIPFLSGNGDGIQGQQGNVRLLGKLKKVDSFEVSDFNELVKAASAKMDNQIDNGSVYLGDKIARDIDKEDLLEHHLSYRVEVTEEESNLISETTNLKIILVILRVQPHEAIEINGPYSISSRYKETLEDAFNEHTDEDITFKNIGED